MATINVNPLIASMLEKLNTWLINLTGDQVNRSWRKARFMRHDASGPWYRIIVQVDRLSIAEKNGLKNGYEDVVTIGVDNSQGRLLEATDNVAALTRVESLPGDGTDADIE